MILSLKHFAIINVILHYYFIVFELQMKNISAKRKRNSKTDGDTHSTR
jgi:hypothetical protein